MSKINWNKFNNNNIIFTEKTLKQFEKEKKKEEKQKNKELLERLREEYLSDNESSEEEKDEMLIELFMKLEKLKSKRAIIRFTFENKQEINSLEEEDKKYFLEKIQKKLLFF